MRLRPATLNDRPALAALQTASWRDSYVGMLPPAYMETRMETDLARHWRSQEIADNDIVLVAEEAEIVGFISIWVRSESSSGPFIDNLHVSPSRRSAGIGGKLMAAAASALIDAGHKTAYLWVYSQNHRATSFYQRHGGKKGDIATKDLFGHSVPVIKIEWTDLSAMIPA